MDSLPSLPWHPNIHDFLLALLHHIYPWESRTDQTSMLWDDPHCIANLDLYHLSVMLWSMNQSAVLLADPAEIPTFMGDDTPKPSERAGIL